MKKLVLIPLLFFFIVNVSAQVTIGNGPTANMFFDAVCNSWRPSGAPANLNIGDLLNDLAAGPTTVSDFDCQNPQICLGPIIVEEPIIYASPFQLTLNSCTNVLIYATIENGDFGDLFFTTASTSSGVSDGYVVVGTGIEGINGLSSSFGSYSSAALPLPLIRGPVSVGTQGGVNIQTPKLLAVVADTLNGAFAQIGVPFIPSGGSITAFSGQSHAIISRIGSGSYARIGHGSEILALPIPPTPIDIINEDGNLWIHAGTTIGNKANIGHVSSNNDTGGNISVIIADGGNNTDGDIDIKGGNENLASIGHFSEVDQSQFVSGNITVQAAGTINMSGGIQSGADAMIGHFSASIDIPVQSAILVESAKGTTLNGGSSSAKAQIGHDAHIVDVATSTMTVGSGDLISLLGNDEGPAVIGHKLDDATGLISGGNINVQSGDLRLVSTLGNNGWTGIGHFDQVGNSSISGDIFITSDDGVHVEAGGAQSFSRIGHDALSKGGSIEILSIGDIDLISGQAISAETTINGEGSIVVYTSQDILMESHSADVQISSVYNNVDVAAIGEIKQQKLGSPLASIDVFPFFNSDLTMRAGDDIIMTQEATNANKIAIHTDYDYLPGVLWSTIPYLGDPFFLFGFSPLGGLDSPIKTDDTFGALLIGPSATFTPSCDIFELFTSSKREIDGLPSFLEVGTTDMVDLFGVLNRITIGDTPQALDSIAAKKQSVSNIQIDGSVLNLDSIFIKANDSLSVMNSTINTTQGMTLIADNEAPVFPFTLSGSLSITQSNLTSGASGIRLYSESRITDDGAGGFVGSTFNGMAHSNCNTICSTEEWVFYYPMGTSPTPFSYMHVYKVPNVALAINGFDFILNCDQEVVTLTNLVMGNSFSSDLDIEMSSDGINWQYYGDWLPPYTSVSIETNDLRYKKYVRLKAESLDGEIEYSEIQRIPCTAPSNVNIYPQPARTLLYIDEKEDEKYILYDVLGNVALEGSSPFDVSTLQSGIYVINNHLWTKPEKIVIAQ